MDRLSLITFLLNWSSTWTSRGMILELRKKKNISIHSDQMFASAFRKPAQLVLRQPLICQTTSSLRTVLMDTPTPGEGLWRRLWLSWPVCTKTLWLYFQLIHDFIISVIIFWRCKLVFPDCLFAYYFDIYRKERRHCKGQRRLHAHVHQKLLRWQWHCWSSGTSPKLSGRCCL